MLHAAFLHSLAHFHTPHNQFKTLTTSLANPRTSYGYQHTCTCTRHSWTHCWDYCLFMYPVHVHTQGNQYLSLDVLSIKVHVIHVCPVKQVLKQFPGRKWRREGEGHSTQTWHIAVGTAVLFSIYSLAHSPKCSGWSSCHWNWDSFEGMMPEWKEGGRERGRKGREGGREGREEGEYSWCNNCIV